MAPLPGQNGRKAHRLRPRRKTPPCSSTASGFYTELNPARRHSVITYQTCFYPAITLSLPSSLLCVLTPICRVIAFDPTQVPRRCSNVDGSASAARIFARGQCRYSYGHGAVLMACSGERTGKHCPCEVLGFRTLNHPTNAGGHGTMLMRDFATPVEELLLWRDPVRSGLTLGAATVAYILLVRAFHFFTGLTSWPC